jgi:predicted metal-dependent hydrolase
MNKFEPPIITGFVKDIYFTIKIEAAADRLGFAVRWIDSLDQLDAPPILSPVRQYGEPLAGPEGQLIAILSRLNPALIIFDLGNTAIPWLEWLNLITAVPATRNIPVLCFGSHRDVQAMQAAKAAGASAVLARSRFVTDLPGLIQQYARIIDKEQVEAACQQPLPPIAIKGLQAFNRGDYFESHEYLEEAWKEEPGLGRELYQAVLQVAVAYLQIERGNYKGAMKMFLRMRQWIDPLPDTCRGIDIANLRREAQHVQETLQMLGAARISEFPLALLKPVSYQL